MNRLNEQRAQVVAEQFFSLKADDITPTTNFGVDPEYTLIAHLPEDINQSNFAIVSKLQTKFPEHYYYQTSQYHLTVVHIPYSMNPPEVIEAITPILKTWHLPIHVQGMVANRLQAGVVLYPEEDLAAQRARLRAALGIPKQAYTAHSPIWEELLWTNVMRFTAKPAEELLALIRTHVNEELGSFVLSQYELYEVSTKTLDPASSRLIHTFSA
jgi:hypothetical protein